MLALHVLAEGHLKQGESHVERLDDVAVRHQGVLPSQRLPPRHLRMRSRDSQPRANTEGGGSKNSPVICSQIKLFSIHLKKLNEPSSLTPQ